MTGVEVLDAAEVRAAIDPGALVEALREVFAEGGVEAPERSHVPLDDRHAATLLLMPAWRSGDLLGVKVATHHPGNGDRGLPAIHGTYLLLDHATGVPRAILDGTELTRWRTAAASALAADHLAPAAVGEHLVVGAGNVAAAVPACYAAVREVGHTSVWARDRGRAARLVEQLRGQGYAADVADDLRAAVRRADVITTATSATNPLVLGEDVSPGTHVDLVGSFSPQMVEADEALMTRARIVVDVPEARHTAGELTGPLGRGVLDDGDVRVTLADVVSGREAGRQSEEQVTAFVSVARPRRTLPLRRWCCAHARADRVDRRDGSRPSHGGHGAHLPASARLGRRREGSGRPGPSVPPVVTTVSDRASVQVSGYVGGRWLCVSMERAGGGQAAGADVWSASVVAAADPPVWVGAPDWESLAAERAADRADEDARGGEGAGVVDEVGWGSETDLLDAGDYQAFMDEVFDALDGEQPDLPVRELQSGLDGARRSLARAGLTAQEAVTVLDEPLTAAIEAVGRLATQLHAVGYTLAREAASRGLHQDVALSLVDWLRVRCPWLPVEDAARIKDVVAVADSPATAQIGEAVAAGTVPLHRGAMVARTMKRLRGSLDPDQAQAYADIATAAAARTDLSDRDLARVCHQLVEDLLHEKKPNERERAAHELRRVTRRRIGAGLTRFTIDAPDGAAATINGVLTGALAAPAPVTDERGQIVEPDTRSARQRGFDALQTVITRGVGNPGAGPSTARASVMLVIPFDPDRGVPTGPATTAVGDYVPPRQAEELGCSGDLTPVWLSADGAPLALGRTARFASPAQWKALAVRDGGCSFPGCTAPPQWCDSHHLDHWARGGHTDTDRMALLCGRHHTHVHQHDLTATLRGGTVTWHL
ncbi:DUF222 domain-containing protein [Serinicoccus kebangsaanensis]|uniref:DUF222 domain-containing protein n=1 Tax=Serinicoccus kebangsaanensis TaxID=2602069 RepID=UPI00124EA236|nr:DUF222 domain-containing protein [Serinicoccus kebangsaanensis]